MGTITRHEPTPAEIIETAKGMGATMSVQMGLHLSHATPEHTLRVIRSADPEAVGAALRHLADLVHPSGAPVAPSATPAVPEYAEAVADALVAARKRLDGPLPVDVRPAVEREAQTLGVTLGSLLARQYLEARAPLDK